MSDALEYFMQVAPAELERARERVRHYRSEAERVAASFRFMEALLRDVAAHRAAAARGE